MIINCPTGLVLSPSYCIIPPPPSKPEPPKWVWCTDKLVLSPAYCSVKTPEIPYFPPTVREENDVPIVSTLALMMIGVVALIGTVNNYRIKKYE